LHLFCWIDCVTLTARLQTTKRVINLISWVVVIVIRVDNHLALFLLPVSVLLLLDSILLFLNLFVPVFNKTLRTGFFPISLLGLLTKSKLYGLLPFVLHSMLPILDWVRRSILHLKLKLSLRVHALWKLFVLRHTQVDSNNWDLLLALVLLYELRVDAWWAEKVETMMLGLADLEFVVTCQTLWF